MKAFKIFIIITAIAFFVWLAIDMTGPSLPKPEPMTVPVSLMVRTIQQADEYANTLESEGYSSDWAHHKAYVEYELLPVDSLYIAIEQD